MKKTIPLALLGLFGAIILSSCNSIPAGDPPDGPIICENSENPGDVLPDDKAAVNHMITEVSTSCTPISAAGHNIPVVSNEFSLFSPEINHMPMDLWRSLVNMKMIKPVSPGQPGAKYKLKSDFRKKQDPDGIEWEISLISLPSGECVWKDSVLFSMPSGGKLP